MVNSFAHLFWNTGEIIADWYPLLRTKALVKNNKRMKPIYITCIFYNIIKIFLISSNFLFIPSSFLKVNNKPNKEALKYKVIWWSIVLVIQINSLFYDVFVIIALKNTLFDKLESFKHKSNNFLEKFKYISELRIFISILISIIVFPCAFFHLYNHIRNYLYTNENSNDINDAVEHFRIIGLRFTYTFMYIDQLLLRYYIRTIKPNYFSDSSQDSELLISPPSTSSVSSPYTPSSLIFSPNPTISIYSTISRPLSSPINSRPLSSPINKNSYSNYEQDISKSIYNNSNPLKPSNEYDSNFYLQNLKNIKNTNY